MRLITATIALLAVTSAYSHRLGGKGNELGRGKCLTWAKQISFNDEDDDNDSKDGNDDGGKIATATTMKTIVGTPQTCSLGEAREFEYSSWKFPGAVHVIS